MNAEGKGSGSGGGSGGGTVNRPARTNGAAAAAAKTTDRPSAGNGALARDDGNRSPVGQTMRLDRPRPAVRSSVVGAAADGQWPVATPRPMSAWGRPPDHHRRFLGVAAAQRVVPLQPLQAIPTGIESAGRPSQERDARPSPQIIDHTEADDEEETDVAVLSNEGGPSSDGARVLDGVVGAETSPAGLQDLQARPPRRRRRQGGRGRPRLRGGGRDDDDDDDDDGWRARPGFAVVFGPREARLRGRALPHGTRPTSTRERQAESGGACVRREDRVSSTGRARVPPVAVHARPAQRSAV
jgi:hypothetical protein